MSSDQIDLDQVLVRREVNEAELAAVAFLFRHHMEERGLAPSTIDRRLATVCGLYRFAHIDGRIGSNPAQYVRRPKVHPSQGHGMDRTELDRCTATRRPARRPPR